MISHYRELYVNKETDEVVYTEDCNRHLNRLQKNVAHAERRRFQNAFASLRSYYLREGFGKPRWRPRAGERVSASPDGAPEPQGRRIQKLLKS